MHTYYSALPFTPHDTCLYRLYKQEISHSITVLQGLNPTWTSCLSSLFVGGFGGDILSVSPDGARLAVSQSKKILILDARTTASQCHISLTSSAACLAFSPSESTLATVSSNYLELWNTTTGINQETQTLSGTNFCAMAFSLQGQYLLLSIDQSLHLHHGTNASGLSVLLTDWNHTNIVFTSHDTQVITGSKEGHIHFFRLSSNRLSEIPERRVSNKAGVLGLVLRYDGKRLASSGEDGTIHIYDLPSGSPIATLQQTESESPTMAMAYHPTEEELAVGQGNCVVLWRQKETPSDWVASIHGYHDPLITGIAYCRNGTQMFTSAPYGPIKLWVTTTTQVQEPPKHAGDIRCYAINQPTSLLATGSEDMSIILWKFRTGNYWKTLRGHTVKLCSLIFSDDGILLASASGDGTSMVWDVETGSCLHELNGQYTNCEDLLAFSEDNTHLTMRSFGGTIFVWELKSIAPKQQGYRRRVDNRTRPYSLEDLNGWQSVVEVSSDEQKKCKHVLFRPPREYGGFEFRSHERGPIFGDRAALFCDDGRVLILDISRVVHRFEDPARQIPDGWWREDD